MATHIKRTAPGGSFFLDCDLRKATRADSTIQFL